MKVLKKIGKSILYAIVIIIVAGLVNMTLLVALKNQSPDTTVMIIIPIIFVILSISYYVTHLGK